MHPGLGCLTPTSWRSSGHLGGFRGPQTDFSDLAGNSSFWRQNGPDNCRMISLRPNFPVFGVSACVRAWNNRPLHPLQLKRYCWCVMHAMHAMLRPVWGQPGLRSISYMALKGACRNRTWRSPRHARIAELQTDWRNSPMISSLRCIISL